MVVKWKIFAQISVDTANGFAFCLEKLALKKLSKNEVYEHIKKILDEQLARKKFIEVN